MNPIPTISKNSPLKIEEATEEYQVSAVERRGRVVFWLGIAFTAIILLATWGVFFLYSYNQF